MPIQSAATCLWHPENCWDVFLSCADSCKFEILKVVDKVYFAVGKSWVIQDCRQDLHTNIVKTDQPNRIA